MPNTKLYTNLFYSKVLSIIAETNTPILIGGGIAVHIYTGFNRPTKDLDIYCKAGDYPKILVNLQKAGIKVKILDERWLAQAFEKKSRVDILFSSPNYIPSVDDSWFDHAQTAKLFNNKVKVISIEELIWCKAYVQDRSRFDGADINHLILFSGKDFNWKRLLTRMENHWEILLSLLINFRYVYPSERNIVPNWLLEELIHRLNSQLSNPIPIDKICRGPLLSRTQYKFDIKKLGFETIA
ncbi:hypothetical protein HYU93_03835 [Candidatus Daviesbacteria bacterium]|nr:hypothetical protein [Candidatus Daviesbacteria bacterium]